MERDRVTMPLLIVDVAARNIRSSSVVISSSSVPSMASVTSKDSRRSPLEARVWGGRLLMLFGCVSLCVIVIEGAVFCWVVGSKMVLQQSNVVHGSDCGGGVLVLNNCNQPHTQPRETEMGVRTTEVRFRCSERAIRVRWALSLQSFRVLVVACNYAWH